jgi:N6-L-threonylcarbamoyladenine synthase
MILGIESSCDESALALFDPAVGLAGEWVSSQIDRHAPYGGVVPELASREHLSNFGPLLAQAKLTQGFERVGSIAVTVGPGLAGCLALGLALGRALGLALGVPVVGVNHLRAHAYSPFVDLHAAAGKDFARALAARLPHLGLLVSGGNTLLFVIEENRGLRELGGTVDDAAGEALDKGAKLLQLGYPGGPLVEREARLGNPRAFDFPRALGSRDEMAFSFSGLKTSLRYTLAKLPAEEQISRRPDLCASYQQAVIDALRRKTRQAAEAGAYRSLGLSGGVSNNRQLRDAFGGLAAELGLPLLMARPEHTGDNAAMIAFAAWVEGQALPSGPHLQIAPALALETLGA